MTQNRLAKEKSPYLLQHANNPVDWYAWGDEAFEKAKREDKPVFLSIGYSTCHWCHVMEHESFEDPEVAKLMNEAFVSIKVDREERPDIDGIYMTVCQMLTGSGGWPLTIIMTPDKKPFFAGTYFPKRGGFGRPGMVELIPKISELWKTRREEALQSATQITSHLSQRTTDSAGAELNEKVLGEGFRELAGRFDPTYGGFGDAPKFPTPHTLLFLMRYGRRTGDRRALEMVEKTLTEMRRGGIYDQVGFGFHRYSTDARWLVPHFEKMLYDQALLAMAYIEAFQATGKPEYAQTAREIFTYVLRDMTSPEGGFYSAEDADSEGVEGKFYEWEGKDILKWAKKPGWEETRKKLFDEREKRVHPHKDDKVLTDWNGLMIAALAKGAQALNAPEYAAAARRAVDFILKTLRRKDGRLLHRYREGEAAILGQVDDYAFLIGGLIDLYEATFDVSLLKTTLELQRHLDEHFWDSAGGGFFFTADDAEQLIARPKESYDGAVPSGNAVAALNGLRLGRITANPDFEKKAAAIGRTFGGHTQQFPSAHTYLLMAVDFAVGPSLEIVIAGDPAATDTQKMLQALRGPFLPNKVVLLRPPGGDPEIAQVAPYTKTQVPVAGKATAYVCENFTCRRPTTDVAEMLASLR